MGLEKEIKMKSIMLLRERLDALEAAIRNEKDDWQEDGDKDFDYLEKASELRNQLEITYEDFHSTDDLAKSVIELIATQTEFLLGLKPSLFKGQPDFEEEDNE